MKLILVILVILVAVALFVLFVPAQPHPAASPVQPATTAGPRPLPGMPPVAQNQPPPAARPQGGLSAPAQATGVTTNMMNLGGGGALEAKQHMTNKLKQINPSGGQNR